MEKSHSDIENVRILISLLVQKGIKEVVLSPGSRNAPLLVSVAREKRLKHHVIVDERSAAFFALGIAQQTGQTVALICTSGTALLNYSPAVAEAYYQGIPLLVISADRPSEWIDQDDSQTIQQQGALCNFVKKSFQLPTAITCNEDRWHTNRLVNEAINLSQHGRKGPVHINVPLREPLYGFQHESITSERVIKTLKETPSLTAEISQNLREEFFLCPKVMIIAGFHEPDPVLQQHIKLLASLPNVVVLTESVTNLSIPLVISTIDRVISTIQPEEVETYAPELLITFGGAIVSRMIKAFIREHTPHSHWHIDERSTPPDTYKSMTLHVPMDTRTFFDQLQPAEIKANSLPSSYAHQWHQREEKATQIHDNYLKRIPWCDLKAFSMLIPALPAGSRLQLGNSTPIRYAQLFRYTQVDRTDANRGTSGIDGCTSTAMGAASTFDGITTLIVGDNSFLYDSNALWIKNCPPSLRIIVIQNGGGGIFRFLAGPSGLEEVEEFFETPHDVDIERLAEIHRFKVHRATDAPSLESALSEFYQPGQQPAILVVHTPGKINGEILKRYFQALRD